MLRTALVVLTAIFMYVILAPYIWLCTLLTGRKEHFFIVASVAWHRALLRAAGVRLTIIGQENLSKVPAGAIFIANHSSYFDISLLTVTLPFGVRFVARDNLFRAPFLGWIMRNSGHIPLERTGSKKTIKTLQHAADKVKQGQNLVIFPEGTRSKDGQLQPFKKGSLLIAKKAQCPIVPVVIHGAHQMMPRHRFQIRSTGVTLIINSPQNHYLPDTPKQDEKTIISDLEKIMNNRLAELSS